MRKKSGALYAAVAGLSENLVRFYFREGEIYHLCYGPITLFSAAASPRMGV